MSTEGNAEKIHLFGHDSESDVSIPVTAETKNRLMNAVFPDEYMIAEDCITPVKKQWIDNCWAFSTIAMLETWLLLNNKNPKKNRERNTFSETHMTYSIFDIRDGGTVPINPSGRTPKKVSEDEHSYGANRVDTASYFAKGLGGVLEVADPNFLQATPKKMPMRSNEISLKKRSKFEVTDIFFLEDPVVPNDQNYINNIKYCIMQHGIVYLSFCYLDNFKNDTTYKAKHTLSYYMNRKKMPDDKGKHAVAIVGWDDNFDSSSFKNKPKKNGAFKAKNSSGTYGYDDGYIWISYEDFNLESASCITEMKEATEDKPKAIYTHSKFGMTERFPGTLGENRVTFSDKFVIGDDNETIVAVGLCNITPCMADVILKRSGSSGLISLVGNAYLDKPGYHLLKTNERQPGNKGDEFTIEVSYNSVGLTSVFVPIEYKKDEGYDNLDLDTVSGSITLSSTGAQETICYINNKDKTNPKKYGNIPLYIVVKGDSVDAKNIFLAYNNLTLPQPTSDGRIDNLPAAIKPPSATADIPIEWRVEPFDFASYNSGYISPVTTYKLGSVTGIVNISSSAYKIFVTAVIGTGKFAMKKMFTATIPVKSGSYSFTISAVTESNKVDISGNFPLEGATVMVSSNNLTKTVKTDSSGNWSISRFELYDPYKGWDDTYCNSSVSVSIKDDNNLEFCKGSNSITLTKPFESTGSGSSTAVIILASAGAVGLIAGIIYCAKSGGTSVTVASGTYTLLGSSSSGSGFSEDTSLIEISGETNNPPKLKTDGPILRKLSGASNLTISVNKKLDSTVNAAASDKFAAIALEITKGGSVTNCSVTGEISGAKEVGGMFFEGEDVTVNNCNIDLKISNTKSYGAVAHTLTGKSSVSQVTVRGDISADKAAGIAINSSGNITKSSVDLNIAATENAAGISCNANSTNISNVFVTGKYKTLQSGSSNSYVSGIVNNMSNGMISDCLVLAEISAESPTAVNYTAGIATTMSGNAVIKNCVVTGKLNSGNSGNAYGVAPGISGNVAAVSNCICVPTVINGKNARRISLNSSSNCIAYNGIINSIGTSFVQAGEILKDSDELLLKNIFTTLKFDMENIWNFDAKKCIPILKNFTPPLYFYPFPNPYPTEDGSGKYKFNPNASVALHGAANAAMQKMTWKNLSPMQNAKTLGQSEKFLLSLDEFYLEMHVAFTQAGNYTVDIISVVDNNDYKNSIILEVV